MTSANIQILKFVLSIVLSIVGLTAFILLDGTLAFFFVSYLVACFISKIANVAYHRWLAHGLLLPKLFGRTLFLWTIVASALVSPVRYVIGHRMHHKFSDTDKDPHSTKLGFWNCLIGNFNSIEKIEVPLKDIFRQKDVMFVEKYYYRLYLLNLIVMAMISFKFALLSFLLINLRMWINITVFNYIAHSKREGKPINLGGWTSFILGYAGEHLHKNHHDRPYECNFGYVSLFNSDIMFYIFRRFMKVK